MAPSPLPVSRSQASKTHLFISNKGSSGPVAYSSGTFRALQIYTADQYIYNGGYSCHYVEQSLRLSLLVTTSLGLTNQTRLSLGLTIILSIALQ